MLLRACVLAVMIGCSVSVDVVASQAARSSGVKPAVPTAAPMNQRESVALESTIRVLVLPPREAKVASQMSGRVIALPVSVGGAFRKGDVLVEFDCEHERAQQEVAQAAVTRTQANHASKQELLKLDAVTDLDVTLAQTELSEAKARLKQADAVVRDCRITAPYSGRLNRRLVNQFENVTQGTPLLEIQESGTPRLEALVPSSALVWLRVGHVMVMRIDELNKDYPVVVSSIGSRIDPASQTVGVRLSFQGASQGVLPGMSGASVLKKPAK